MSNFILLTLPFVRSYLAKNFLLTIYGLLLFLPLLYLKPQRYSLLHLPMPKLLTLAPVLYLLFLIFIICLMPPLLHTIIVLLVVLLCLLFYVLYEKDVSLPFLV
jgi:hypothetical protein